MLEGSNRRVPPLRPPRFDTLLEGATPSPPRYDERHLFGSLVMVGPPMVKHSPLASHTTGRSTEKSAVAMPSERRPPSTLSSFGYHLLSNLPAPRLPPPVQPSSEPPRLQPLAVLAQAAQAAEQASHRPLVQRSHSASVSSLPFGDDVPIGRRPSSPPVPLQHFLPASSEQTRHYDTSGGDMADGEHKKRKRAGVGSIPQVELPSLVATGSSNERETKARDDRERGRKGNPKACRRCKRSKLRCESKNGGPCNRCQAVGEECVQPAQKATPAFAPYSPRTQRTGSINPLISSSMYEPKLIPAPGPSSSSSPGRVFGWAPGETEPPALEESEMKINAFSERLAIMEDIRPHNWAEGRQRLVALEARIAAEEARLAAELEAPNEHGTRSQTSASGAPTVRTLTAAATIGQSRSSVAFILNPAEDMVRSLSPDWGEEDPVPAPLPQLHDMTDCRRLTPVVEDTEEVPATSTPPTAGQHAADVEMADMSAPVNVLHPPPQELDSGSLDYRGRPSNPPADEPLSSNDAIGRRLIKEEEGEVWWRQIVDTFKTRIPWGRTTDVTFTYIRDRSDILSNVALAYTAFRQELPCVGNLILFDAKSVARDMGTSPVRRATLSDVRGMLLFIIAAGHHHFRAFASPIVHSLGLHQVFPKLTDQHKRGSAHEGLLCEKGRLWLVFQVFNVALSHLSMKEPTSEVPSSLLRQHAACLRTSREHSLPAFDAELEAQLRLSLILREAWERLGVQDNGRTRAAVVQHAVPDLFGKLDAWRQRFWDPSRSSPSAATSSPLEDPILHAKVYTLYLATRPTPGADHISLSRQSLTFALQGFEIALDIAEAAKQGPLPVGDTEFTVEWYKLSFGLVVATLMNAVLLIPGHLGAAGLSRAEKIIDFFGRRHREPGRRLGEHCEAFDAAHHAIGRRRLDWIASSEWTVGMEAPPDRTTGNISENDRELIDALAQDTRLWFMCGLEPEYY